MYVAIHIISESSDHYNLLYKIKDISDVNTIMSDLEKSIMEDPAYWSNFYVSSESDSVTTIMKNILSKMIDKGNEESTELFKYP